MYSTVTRNRNKANDMNRQIKQISLVAARQTPRKSYRNGGNGEGNSSKHAGNSGDPNSNMDDEGQHVDDFSAAINKEGTLRETNNISF